jgi:guanylate kinase
MPLMTSSIELQASSTSCKYADTSRAIDQFLCSINLASNNLVLHRSLHHQVNVGLENIPKRLASVKKDMEALGDFQWAKLNKKVNIAFSRYEILS